MENAKLKAEDVFDYWVPENEANKKALLKLGDRRVEVAGKGRGTVAKGNQKGLLINFDGYGADFEGCFNKMTEGRGAFQEMIRPEDLKSLGWRVLNESSVRLV